MIGQILNNRYKIVKLLGEGGMGEVYLAIDETNKQEVAVKILAHQLVTNAGLIDRFRREAETLRKLDHPNIVKFIDAFEYGSQYVIVMEYISGGNLQDLIKRGRLPVERAKGIALEICDALIRSHHLNIVHRDIKPENILLTKDGKPKLADFGVARLNEGSRMTRTGTQVGTPYYMAPEAWEGKPLDAQADIWSLGIVFFEMLTGQPPFEGDTGAVVMNKVLTTPLPDIAKIRKGVPTGIREIISGMLIREKRQRYQSVRQVAADLEKGISSIDLNTTRIISSESARSPRKNWTWILGGVFAVFAVVFWVMQGQQSNTGQSESPTLLTEQIIKTVPVEITVTPSITPTPTLTFPLSAGTPIPELEIISLENIDQLEEIARWGDGKINDLIFSVDNKYIYAGTSIGLYVYDAETLDELSYIPRNSITKLVMSPDGKQLAFLEEGQVIAYNPETNEENVFSDESGWVKLQYLSDGNLYGIRVTFDEFENIKSTILVNLLNGSVVAELNLVRGSSADVISPDGKFVGMIENKLVTLYDLTTSRKSRSYGSHPSRINAIAFSSDQKLLASGDRDGKVYIWNLESGQPIYIFSATETIYYLKFSPDNLKILAALENGTIQAWDLTTGKIDISYTGHVGEMASFSVSEDGAQVVAGAFDGKILVWSSSDGKRLAETPSGSAGITKIDISPDSLIVASGANDNTVILWELATGQILKDFPGSSVSFSNQTFCGNCDFYGVQSLSFSPDGYSLAAGYTSERGTLWDVKSGKAIRPFEGDAFTFCPNQAFSVSASLKAVHFIDSITGEEKLKLSGKTCSVDAVACSKDGNLFAYRGTQLGCGGLPDKVILMGLENMVDLYEFRGESLYSPELLFSPDGTILAAGASDGIMLWETTTGHQISGPTLDNEIYPTLADFTPNGSILAYLSGYNRISFFDIANGETIGEINIETSNFRAFIFTHDGKYLITGHSDGTIRIWGIKP